MSADLLLLPLGVCVGVINSVAGGGQIVSFPVWLALGYSPFVANVSNTVGIFPGNLGGAAALRHELHADRRLTLTLVVAGGLGSATGAVLLLALPHSSFEAVVPWLILFATGLLVVQPWVNKWRVGRSGSIGHSVGVTVVSVFCAAIYGGYFGATMGVILLAVLGLTMSGGIHRANAFKNAIALAINAVGVVVFAIGADVAWRPALIQAVGTLAGGLVGGRIATRLPEAVFRWIVVVVGVIAAVVVVAG